MKIELKIVGGTDKTVRVCVVINGEETGELQMGRSELTKMADLLFGKEYTISR